MRVSEACSRFIEVCKNNKNLSNLTLKAYKADLKQLRECIDESQTISEITRFQLLDFRFSSIRRLSK